MVNMWEVDELKEQRALGREGTSHTRYAEGVGSEVITSRRRLVPPVDIPLLAYATVNYNALLYICVLLL